NVAYPGDTTYDLSAQIDHVVKSVNSGRYDEIAYVTVLIGSNDACTDETAVGTPLQTMHDNLMSMFAKLASIQQKDPIRVLLIGMPRIPDLGTPEYRNASTVFELSCETVRNKILKFCNPLLLWNTPEEYDAAMMVVEDKNRLLREVSE